MLKKYGIYLLLAGYAVAALLTGWLMDGTGDPGDGVMHYLFARYAPRHPELYFHHWAKPMYVLLASPFAQAGIQGVHAFNVICTLLTLLFTFRTAVALRLPNPLAVVVLMAFTPFYYIVTFSGLTEPLFALFTAAGIYWAVRERWLASALVFSFLPFVRSEGLIIIGVIGFYLLLKRQWKWIPLLLAGHVVYALAGWFIHHEILWIFTKIPYAKMSSNYGHGTWNHFFFRMFDVLGAALYVLLGLGVLAVLGQSLSRKAALSVQVLVFLGFGGFFTAHSLFWALGIFNSMGLHRVFIGIMPMMGLLMLYGYNLLVEDLPRRNRAARTVVAALVLGAVMFFPFSGNPVGLNWQRDFMLDNNQRVLKEQVGAWILAHQKPNARKAFLIPYLNHVLEMDPFATGRDRNLTLATADTLRSGDLIVWDSWFAPVEQQVTREILDRDTTLQAVFSTTVPGNTPETAYVIYEKK